MRSTPATPAARSSAATSTSTTGRAAPPRTPGASVTSPSPRRRTRAPATCSARSPRPRLPASPARGRGVREHDGRAASAHARAEQRRSCRADSPPRRSDAPLAVKLAIAAGNQLIDEALHLRRRARPATHRACHRLRLLGVDQLRAPRWRRVRRLRRGLDRARELRAGRARPVDHRLRQQRPRVRRRCRDRARHRLVRAGPADRPGSGPRWQPASIIPAQYAGDEAAGNGGFVQRHPAGL